MVEFRKLIEAINISGTNVVIISKTDVLKELGKFKLSMVENLENMKLYIKNKLLIKCYLLNKVIFSDSPSVVFD